MPSLEHKTLHVHTCVMKCNKTSYPLERKTLRLHTCVMKRKKRITQRTLWNVSSPRMRRLLIPKNDSKIRIIVIHGAQSQVRNIGPSPVRNGGELNICPNSSKEAPGKTRTAPTMLATAHAANRRVKLGRRSEIKGESHIMCTSALVQRRLPHALACNADRPACMNDIVIEMEAHLFQDRQGQVSASIWQEIATLLGSQRSTLKHTILTADGI